jgi:hypothetical protein
VRSELAISRCRRQGRHHPAFDVWDGFVDPPAASQQGPDFEGQIRRLRLDGVIYPAQPVSLRTADAKSRG